MKKIYLFAIVSVVALFFSSCGKDKVEPTAEIDYSGPSYLVKFADMQSGDGTKAVFSTPDYLKLIYENNDRILVNGHEFVLHYVNGVWRAYATSSEGLVNDTLQGSSFACFYGKSPATTSPNGTDSYGNVSFVGDATIDAERSAYKHYRSGIVLAGTTLDSVITLYPSFAVIRVATGPMAQQFIIDQLAFGFDANVALKKATVTPNEGTFPTISEPTYLAGVTHTTKPNPFPPHNPMDVYSGEFFDANTSDQNHMDSQFEYHLFVPLKDDNVETNIYIKTKMRLDGDTYIYYNKIENVSLSRGVVYTFDVFDEGY